MLQKDLTLTQASLTGTLYCATSSLNQRMPIYGKTPRVNE